MLTPLQRELLRDLKKQPVPARVTFYFDRPAFVALAALCGLGYAKFDGQTYTVTSEGRKALDPYRRFQPGQQVRLKTDQAYKAGTVGFVQRYGDPDNRHDLMYLNMGSDLLFNVGDTFLPGWQVGVWVAEDEIEIVSIPTFDSLPEDKQMLQFVHVKADGTPTLNYRWLDAVTRAMLLLELDIWAAQITLMQEDLKPILTIQEAVTWSVNAHFGDWYTDDGDLVVVPDDTRTWIVEQLTRKVQERYT